jgi:hypothetical protein
MSTRTTHRCEELSGLGLIFSFKENAYIGKDDNSKDFYIPSIDIQFIEDDAWNVLIEKLKTEISNRHESF